MASTARTAALRSQPITIGSNGPVTAGLVADGLGRLFPGGHWSDVALGRGKPAPEIFLLAARRLVGAPAGYLVYEDAEHGIAAALGASTSAVNVLIGDEFASR